MWTKDKIRIGSEDFECQINAKDKILEIELSYTEDWTKLLESDSINVNNNTYKIINATDVAERHEKVSILCVQQEVKKHEPKSNKRSKTN